MNFRSVCCSWFIALTCLSPLVYSSSLYSLEDPLWELDSSNFERIVFNKNNAWIIEFYSSWCGHCIRFAPVWKVFARDIENWKNVIEIGVVNCADAENVNLCRDYGVHGYPTIKLFWTHLNKSDKGEKFEAARSLPNLRHAIIDFIHAHENRSTPQHFPALKETKAGDIASFWNEIPSSVSTVYVVIENPWSYVGREVILDLSIKKHITARRVLTRNKPLLEKLLPDYKNTTLTLVKLSRDGAKETLYTSPDGANTTSIRDDVFDIVIGGPRVKEQDEKPDDKDGDKISTYNGVHMADIENAVRYALRQEVGVQEIISGAKKAALKDFLSALKKYFPGTPGVRGYLARLSNWVNGRKGNLTGARFVTKMNELQTDSEFLPEMHEYVGCRGSQPKYRGYPCSLWTLFHTLTVQAYNIFEENPMVIKEAPQKVLFDIRGYVTHFFTCEGCSRHFQEMSANLEAETKSPKDTVLWLWRAHNKVNKRLAGDATEDPKHKKIQFPSYEACKKCRLEPSTNDENIQWDNNAVLRYVRYFYAKERIKPVGKGSESNSIRYPSVNTIAQGTSTGSSEVRAWNNGNAQLLLQVLNILPFLRQAPEI